MRWGPPEAFYVAVIDGGTQDSGRRLVEHVRGVYRAQHINYAINSHPDCDHSSGLAVVLENFPVRELVMHRPWLYPDAIKHLFRNRQFTTEGLSGRIREALDAAYALDRIATRRGISIVEPYQGSQFGPLRVLSPTQADYLRLIPHFQNTPQPALASPLAAVGVLGALAGLGQADRGGAAMARRGLLDLPANPARGGLIDNAMGGLGLADLAQRAAGNVETWLTEKLKGGQTSEQNESSTVVYGCFNGTGVLLTADAGTSALSTACAYAQSVGISLPGCTYYQVPHHGSRRNVSPAVLNALLGPPSRAPQAASRYAIASVAAGSTSHPRKAVTNAFLRRGVSVCATKGSVITIRAGYPRPPGTTDAHQIPFHDVVEDD